MIICKESPMFTSFYPDDFTFVEEGNRKYFDPVSSAKLSDLMTFKEVNRY